MPTTLVGCPDREPDRQPTITVSTTAAHIVWTTLTGPGVTVGSHITTWTAVTVR